METRAPSFSKSYPLQGEITGRVWGLLWQELDHRKFKDGPSLAEHVVRYVDTSPKTVIGLLQAARRRGLLEVEYVAPRGKARKRAYYRVTQKGLEQSAGKMSAKLKVFLYGGVHFDD